MLRGGLLVLVVACGSKSTTEPAAGSSTEVSVGGDRVSRPITINEFVARQPLTFVYGTAGDERSDLGVRAQVDLVRALAFPTSPSIADTAITQTWPANPVVYGGAHVNAAIAAIAKDLPFEITANRLTIGGQTFERDDLALITVVPARAGRYPELLLFAGTGTPGVTEINSGTMTGANAPIVIADAFGPWITGIWKVGADGSITAQLNPPRRRVAWRETRRTIRGAEITFELFEGTADRDTPMIAEAEAGIATALDRLAPARGDRPIAFTVVIHPDKRSKATLTGNAGDGHAVGFANTLHVWAHRGLAYLTTHEATHSILFLIWPPAGSQLLGEGLAVWATGGYAGQPLASFKGTLKARPIKELLATNLAITREAELYPLGGVVVDVLVAKVGLANVRDHLYGATAATWDDACKAAGTTADALDAAFVAALR